VDVPVKGKISAALRLVPLGSQVFVSIAAVGGIALMLAGAYWNNILAFSGGAGTFVISFVAFLLTCRNADRVRAPRTELQVTEKSVTLKMDPVSASSLEGARLFADVVAARAYRQPLPSPSGLVSATMKPTPGSQAEAARLVDYVNAAADKRDMQLQEAIDARKGMGAVAQIPAAEKVATSLVDVTPDLSQQVGGERPFDNA